MSANPHANGGTLRKPLRMPDFREYAVRSAQARDGCGSRTPLSWASFCAT